MADSNLQHIIDSHMCEVPEANSYCQGCLKVQRWEGNITLMIVDAAFTSIGLNYFQVVIPGLELFKREFIDSGKVKSLDDLITENDVKLKTICTNGRSWHVARAIASHLASIKREKNLSDRDAFIYWARHTSLDKWKEDPIGDIKGIGINTFQYLRMMGGIDTVMPDKIVRKVMGEILRKCNISVPSYDIDFIVFTEQIAKNSGYKAIELCWMTWLINK